MHSEAALHFDWSRSYFAHELVERPLLSLPLLELYVLYKLDRLELTMDDTQLTYHAIKALGEDDTPVSGFVLRCHVFFMCQLTVREGTVTTQ